MLSQLNSLNATNSRKENEEKENKNNYLNKWQGVKMVYTFLDFVILKFFKAKKPNLQIASGHARQIFGSTSAAV